MVLELRSLLRARLKGAKPRLSELGRIESRIVAIEFRWTEGRNDRLAEMAADLAPPKRTLVCNLQVYAPRWVLTLFNSLRFSRFVAPPKL
jgi:hypothetical protein